MMTPKFDPSNASHRNIWNVFSSKLTDEDFQEIQKALIIREDTLDAIEHATVMPRLFSMATMMQPRSITSFQKDCMRRYADWECAKSIMMVLSQYCDFFAKE